MTRASVQRYKRQQEKLPDEQRIKSNLWLLRMTQLWVSALWRAMSATGRGYRMHSLKNTGRKVFEKRTLKEDGPKIEQHYDERKDKTECRRLGIPPWLRRYSKRYTGASY